MKNWRILITFFLSSLILYNSLRVSFTYIYYNIDTKGFIEAFCENIDKPELECNGKCHLKKVVETDNKDNNRPIQLIDLKNLLLYNENLTTINLKPLKLKKKEFFLYKNLYNYKISFSLFHPPEV